VFGKTTREGVLVGSGVCDWEVDLPVGGVTCTGACVGETVPEQADNPARSKPMETNENTIFFDGWRMLFTLLDQNSSVNTLCSREAQKYMAADGGFEMPRFHCRIGYPGWSYGWSASLELESVLKKLG
jgi:hypothetical protein